MKDHDVANMYFCCFLKELISANGERHRLQEENNNLDLRLNELSAEYTNRLQQYIHDIAVRILLFSTHHKFSIMKYPRKTKVNVITFGNYKRHKQVSEPIESRRKYMHD